MELKPRSKRIKLKLKNRETVEYFRGEASKEGNQEEFKKRFAIEIERIYLKMGMFEERVSSCTGLYENFLEKMKQLNGKL